MTDKQKRNQARFKKVVAEAKKLRAKNPKLTQAEAVKKAWAMQYGSVSGYEKTTKRGSTTTVTYSNKAKKSIKKKAAKKPTQGRLFGASTHKDTKSHNVNIRVVSGIKLTYKIFEGYDWSTGKPLYHVTGMNNDYVGEWHTTKKEAQKEMQSLRKTTVTGIYKGTL
jgi:hypothetical protein